MQIESTTVRPVPAPKQTMQATPLAILLAIATWLVLVLVAFVWGSQVNHYATLDLGAPPLFGHFDFRLSPSLLPIVVVGALILGAGVRETTTLKWKPLLYLAWLGSLAWTVALNTLRGLHQLAAPLTTRFEYGAAVKFVHTPQRFLESFVARLSSYPIHVQGHPPGMVLLLWAMKQIGLGAAGWEAALVIGAGTSSVVAALLVCRSVAGEVHARRCAPFLVLAPMALWVATSADGLFLGLSAWGIALSILAFERRRTHGWVLAVAGGGLLGLALMLSYGALPLVVVPFVIGLRSRRFAELGYAAAAVAAVLGAFWAAGFSWLEGLQATRQLYAAGIAAQRPYLFFCFANLAAFAIVIGPAGFAGLASLRNRSLWFVVGATGLVLLLSDLSGYSKGEVERIWLPFAPWLLIATADLPSLVVPAVLGLQAAVGVAVTVGVRTPW